MELIQLIKNYYDKLHLSVNNFGALRFARRLVYVWVFINYTILSTENNFFYSDSSYIPSIDFDGLSIFDKTFNLLHWKYLANSSPLFLGLILLFSALAFWEKLPRISAASVYFFMMNLDNKASVILDGGNNLMHLLAFYLIFVNTKSKQSEFSIALTNISALMIKVQIAFVYATAGLLKVMGPLWNKGAALYYTMGVPEYGNPAIFDLLTNFPVILSMLTLGTVLFQISLPYLIWLRPWRPYIIAIGTSLHLSISLVMGLFMFGLAMCVSYFFFMEDNERGLASSFYSSIKSALIKGLT
jgi:hypothetical protein